MKLRSLDIDNFRKFRKPLALSGFSDGLNIVVEPNEAGKSTLLEALRAALFVRHSAKSELVRSYCPSGDDVAPRVGLSFDIGADSWRLDKQFLKSFSISLSGPSGRFEGDAAEDRLQRLLGFDKGNNRGTDYETRGALGLLWVEQASALSVEAPGQLVRDNIRNALEAEVGAVLGGRRFEIVRTRVEEAYTALRTAKAGKATGRLEKAETEARLARERRETADEQFRTYEKALENLEQARTQKRLVDRELDDPEQTIRRGKLAEELKLAESALLRLTAAEARYAEGDMNLKALEGARAAREEADTAGKNAALLSEKAATALAEHDADYQELVKVEAHLRTALDGIRKDRLASEKALESARDLRDANERRRTIARMRGQLAEVEAIEIALASKEELAKIPFDAKQVDELAKLERKFAEARALRDAGAVSLDIRMTPGETLTIDGEPADEGHHEILKPTTIAVGRSGTLDIAPPASVGRSASAAYETAVAAYEASLQRLGVEDYPAALARLNIAQAAGEDLAILRRQIEVLCPGDPALVLAPGAAALKLFLAGAADVAENVGDNPDIATLTAAHANFIESEREASGRHESAVQLLHRAETKLVQLKTERLSAARDADMASDRLAALDTLQDPETFDARLEASRSEFAKRLEAREEAKRAADAMDAQRIQKSISNHDQAIKRAQNEKLELLQRIASLETTVASEGPKGLAGQAAEAAELEKVASEYHKRLEREADILALLRTSLREASEASARTFLAPVTRRAAAYVERILPGSDLLFGEDMGLAAIRRNGLDELCGDLSRGTQEQLAVLTRLAFADLLLEKDAPVSLILDDPLVYSDDARLEAMTELLEEAAKRMQIILLTCRAKAFRHVDAHRITI